VSVSEGAHADVSGISTQLTIEGDNMRELTIHDLDSELAEQLPARELMNAVAISSASATNVGIVAVQLGTGNAASSATAINIVHVFVF
jgi:hypothetical protein